MNFKYIKSFAVATVLAITASCSSDYLETHPTDEISPDLLYKDTKGIKMAVNGLAKIMVTQHISQGFNGEGTIKLYYGEYMGNNFRVDIPDLNKLINGELYNDGTSTYDYYPWHYYYMLITNANPIIEKVDGADGPANEKMYLKAQAYAYRAYAYTMLAQIYGHRWDDSNNGEQKCLVLRTSTSQEVNLTLSSLKEVYATIYSDLDKALELFKESGYDRNGINFQIDASVAKAIYARAALAKKDYVTAEKYAIEARAKAPLMNVAAYKEGFANPTSEWIWSSYGASDEQLHFYSYQAYIGYNSSAGAVRTYPKRIAKELYQQIPSTDIRRNLFLDPTDYNGTYNVNSGKTAKGSEMDKAARKAFPALYPTASVAAYMQFKIKANDLPGVGNTNHFRSSEMYLIEAEAKHFLGNDVAAAKLLEELTAKSGRDVAYTCTKSGKELFKEIVKYRGIELWGEGFDWFDMKRWNIDIERKEGITDANGKDVITGGNYTPSLAVKIPASASHKWTWTTPNRETDFNNQTK